jgi:hypothetical protein
MSSAKAPSAPAIVYSPKGSWGSSWMRSVPPSYRPLVPSRSEVTYDTHHRVIAKEKPWPR